jgi:hypothetical protein
MAGKMQKFTQFDLPNIAYRTCKLDRGGPRTIRQFFAQPYNGRIIRLVDELIYVCSKCYIACVCDIEDPALIATSDVLRVDFGIVNIATDSDTKSFVGRSRSQRKSSGL